jgi:hypothetical protein
VNDAHIKAGAYHEQAERMRELGLNEKNKKRRETLLAIAEHYYLLHDQYLELWQLHEPCAAGAEAG